MNFLTARGYKITVATSTEREKVKYYFAKANITKFFNEIVCGDMIQRGKPEPDIYIKACEIIELSPADCLALEDSPSGILSAYNAGLKPVMIPDLVEPDEITNRMLFARLSSLKDVTKLLD